MTRPAFVAARSASRAFIGLAIILLICGPVRIGAAQIRGAGDWTPLYEPDVHDGMPYRLMKPIDFDGLLLQNPPDRRLSDVNTRSCQHVGNLYLAKRWAEQFDLLDSVANEVRKAVHRRVGLDQRVVVGASEPCTDGVV